MLFRTSARLGRPPYSVFLKKYAKKVNYADFKGSHKAKFVARARALGKMYRALPAAEKKAIVAEAKTAKAFPKSKVRLVAASRRRTAAVLAKQVKGNKANVLEFVRRHYKKVEHQARGARVAKLAKLWAKRH